MTVWRAGMLAVCVDTGVLQCRRGDAISWHVGCDRLELGAVYRVEAVGTCGALCKCTQLRLSNGALGTVRRFRPAVSDDQACEEEFITLLNRSKPAKTPVIIPTSAKAAFSDRVDRQRGAVAVAVPHAVMGPASTPHTLPRAGRVGASVNSDTGGGFVDAGGIDAAPTISVDPVPRGDVQQHADCCLADRNEFTVPHGAPDSRKGKQDHA